MVFPHYVFVIVRAGDFHIHVRTHQLFIVSYERYIVLIFILFQDKFKEMWDIGVHVPYFLCISLHIIVHSVPIKV